MKFPVVLLALFSSSVTLAHTPAMTADGKRLRWEGARKLDLAGLPTNGSGLSSSQIFQSVVRGLQRWEAASGGAVRFDYWQGTDPAHFSASSDYDGASRLSFASQRAQPLDASLVGYTQVWYDTRSGEILETDLVFNDAHYLFTTNPTDTSTSGPGSRVYFDGVLTHELGHAWGLAHSPQLQSTMFFVESREQSLLSCEDQSALRAHYGATSGEAVLSGRVVGPDGSTPVFGAHVHAVSLERGTTQASAVSTPDGRFRISGLEPGRYTLFFEPFLGGASTLPEYYAGMNARVCAGSTLFLRDARRITPDLPHAEVLAVTSGEERAIGDHRVSCALPAPQLAGRSFSLSSGQFAAFSRLGTAVSAQELTLLQVSGDLELQATSYSLYSPARVRLELYTAGGVRVATQEAATPIFTGASGFRNHDSLLRVPGLTPGSYVLRFTREPIASSEYPAPWAALDAHGFVLLSARLGFTSESVSAYAERSRCVQNTGEFPAYQSPAGPPPRRSLDGDQEANVGFCAQIEGGGSPPTPGQWVGLMLPFLLAFFATRSRRDPALERA
jgi:hypothetical protein